jgi:pimeloyl-ACP methyl ester carboxylesterase
MRIRETRLSRIRGALMLVGEAVDHLTTRIHEFHRAISDIPFASIGAVPVARGGSQPVRMIHDGITDGVYEAVRGTARTLFKAADSAIRAVQQSSPVLALPAPAPAPDRVAPARQDLRVQDDLVAALSGAIGDHMAARRNPLAIRFGLYQDGMRVRMNREGLGVAFASAGPRIAVFVHGLCGNENVWGMFRDPDDEQTVPYGERLARELGYTPVYLRYNSGLHISHNGRMLSRLLDQLVLHWPQPIQHLVLIGHSMGGLVARSGAETARRRAAPWLGHLRQIVCLGSPHLGAPLEKAVHLGTALLRRLPLSRPAARLLDARSLGIKDLRWGYTADEEWKGRDPDELWTDDRLQYPPVPGVQYRFLGSCLTRDPEHPLSRAVGDGLVRVPSSLAGDVAAADSALRVQLNHLRLLNHPDVYAQLRRWLQENDGWRTWEPRVASGT